jgi:hypothetical protein
MRVRSAQLNPVGKVALEGHLIPFTNLFWIQVIDHRQSIKLVEAGGYISIFDIRQAAQMDNEIGTPALARQFITRSLHVSIRQAEALAGPAKPGARLHVRSGKFSRVAQTAYRHVASYLSVMFPEQRPLRQSVLLAHEKRIPMQFTILAKGKKGEGNPFP